MTTLADMGVDAHRRDRWGRMLVVPPDGTEPMGYTRVTTVAKALDEGGGLAPWKATMCMLGAYARPGLRSRWETLIAATAGDPWYASSEAKAQAKALVEECAKVGGASDRAEQGTSLHALTALVDVNRTVTGLTPDTEADLSAYVNTLIREGISVVELWPGQPAVEVTVVLDRQHVAGTADRIVAVPGFDLPLIADLKTGDLTYGWHAIAVQLAAYAHGDAVYWQGADPNGSTDERTAMPEVDQRHGLIINLRPGSAHVDLYVVDIEAGWRGFGLSLAARQWRGERALVMDLPPIERRVNALHVVEQPPALTLVPPVAEVEQRPHDGAAASPTSTAAEAMPAVRVLDTASTSLPQQGDACPHGYGTPEACPACEGEEALPTTAELRAWLQQRIDTIGAHATARESLAHRWAALGVPSLRSSTAHTAEELAAIEALCDDIEARFSFPFGPSRPGTDRVPEAEWLQRLLGTFPGSTVEAAP
jgi:hypothetical protein